MIPRFYLPLALAAALDPVAAIWPAPQSYTLGTSTVYLNSDIQVTYNGQNVRWPSPGLASTRSSLASSDPSSPHIFGALDTKYLVDMQLPTSVQNYELASYDNQMMVQASVSRVLGDMLNSTFVPWMLRKRNSDFEPPADGENFVKTLAITQSATDEPSAFKPLAGQVDESYKLSLSEDGAATLDANSSVGVLRGLETFSQLFYAHSSGGLHYTPYAPVSVEDAPKFPHRGVLLDTARHYLPVSHILKTIDALAWNKMNRLHLHLTDSQSWPLVVPAMPELSEKGAYSQQQIYTPDDIQNIQDYGVMRGVEVIMEIDTPSHIGVVAESHPDLIVAYDAQPYFTYCAQPPCGAVKLGEPKVDEFMATLLGDLLPRVSPYSAYYHTGGDELNANSYLLQEGLATNDTTVLQPLVQKFFNNQFSLVTNASLTPMVWEEIPLDWNVTLPNETVVQTWRGQSSVDKLTAAGQKIIDSNYEFWYLDCGRGQWLNFVGAGYATFYPFNDWCSPTKNWRLIYSHDPVANMTEEQAKLVLGGEVAVWSETIDPANLDSLIWPRASAAGEVLWSGRQDSTGQNRSQEEAAPRLAEMRERLIAHGIMASPFQMAWCYITGNASSCTYPNV